MISVITLICGGMWLTFLYWGLKIVIVFICINSFNYLNFINFHLGFRIMSQIIHYCPRNFVFNQNNTTKYLVLLFDYRFQDILAIYVYTLYFHKNDQQHRLIHTYQFIYTRN